MKIYELKSIYTHHILGIENVYVSEYPKYAEKSLPRNSLKVLIFRQSMAI